MRIEINLRFCLNLYVDWFESRQCLVVYLFIIFYSFGEAVLTVSKMAIVVESSLHDADTSIADCHVVIWLSPSQGLGSGDGGDLIYFEIISVLYLIVPFAIILEFHVLVCFVHRSFLHFKNFVISLSSRFHLLLLKSWCFDDIILLENVHVWVLAIELLLQSFNLFGNGILCLLVLFLHTQQRQMLKLSLLNLSLTPPLSGQTNSEEISRFSEFTVKSAQLAHLPRVSVSKHLGCAWGSCLEC